MSTTSKQFPTMRFGIVLTFSEVWNEDSVKLNENYINVMTIFVLH